MKYIALGTYEGRCGNGETLLEAYHDFRNNWGDEYTLDDMTFHELGRVVNVEMRIVEVKQVVEAKT